MSTGSDNTDHATYQEMLVRDKAISIIRRRAGSLDTSNPKGLCLSCGRPTGQAQRWCNAACRDSTDET